MERKITTYLQKWKNDLVRKPLLVYGPKQVGKTFAILEFGEKEYKNVVYFNTDNNKELADLFTKEEIRNINLNDIEIEELDFENIGNKELLSKIINQIKVILDECIKTIKANKDDKEKIKVICIPINIVFLSRKIVAKTQ